MRYHSVQTCELPQDSRTSMTRACSGGPRLSWCEIPETKQQSIANNKFLKGLNVHAISWVQTFLVKSVKSHQESIEIYWNLLISIDIYCVPVLKCLYDSVPDTCYPATSPRWKRSNETRENAERAVIAARQADMALHVVWIRASQSIDINWSNFMQYLVAKIITLNWSLKLFGGVPTLTRIQQ